MATAAVRRGIAARQLLLVEDAPQLLVTNQRKKRRRRVHVEQQLSLRQGKEENVEGRWDGGTEKPKVGANLEAMRKNYFNPADPFLLEPAMARSPFAQFDRWFKALLAATEETGGGGSGCGEEVNAVALATCRNNRPSVRMVLLKRYDDRAGFVFFTHASSRKGVELADNPHAAMMFYWPNAARQVRIEGVVRQLPAAVAQDYWTKRPIASRIGSKLSEQSHEIPSREYLDARQEQLKQLLLECGEEAISRPDDWLAYQLVPDYFEFWQGQRDRVHDRIVYERSRQPVEEEASSTTNDNKKEGENQQRRESEEDQSDEKEEGVVQQEPEWTMKRLAP